MRFILAAFAAFLSFTVPTTASARSNCDSIVRSWENSCQGQPSTWTVQCANGRRFFCTKSTTLADNKTFALDMDDTSACSPISEPSAAQQQVTPPPPAAMPRGAVYPADGLQAPELRDAPLKAYSYNHKGPFAWPVCGYCAKVKLDPYKTYLVIGPEGVVPVNDRYGRTNSVIGNLNGDTLVSEVELKGIPVTFFEQGYLWLEGTDGEAFNVTLQEVKLADGRPNYWVLNKAGEITLRIFGNLDHAQELSVPPSYHH